MAELQALHELTKQLGTPALIFAIWYFYHKSTSNQFKDVLEKNFKLLEGLIKTNNENTGLLIEIKSKIADKFYCPYTRQFIKQDNDGLKRKPE